MEACTHSFRSSATTNHFSIDMLNLIAKNDYGTEVQFG